MSALTDFVKRLLNDNYDIGEITRVEYIKEGDTNNSFFAYVMDPDEGEKKWYVRQYCTAEEERDVIYEHAFDRYFRERVQGEIQTMVPLETKSGSTWVVSELDGETHIYAMFTTISGFEPYSWEYNAMPQTALDSCADITAKFQTWAYGFVPPEGIERREPPMEALFDIWRKDLPSYLAEKKKDANYRRFTDYFQGEIPFLIDTIDFCEKELAKYDKDLKHCINHKDLNPGNVMFDENDHVNAVFDMDWVNTDYRLYDIAWMGYQVIASWDTDSWGAVPVEQLTRFVDRYNKIMVERKCPMGPLNEAEIAFLPTMMIIGAIKVVVDFTCYEDHYDEVHRMFVNTWRFMSSIHELRDYVENIKGE